MGGAPVTRTAPGAAGIIPSTSLARVLPRGRGSLFAGDMDQYEPKLNPDKILAIAAYLVGDEPNGPPRDDVKKEFRNASEPYSRELLPRLAVGGIQRMDREV